MKNLKPIGFSRYSIDDNLDVFRIYKNGKIKKIKKITSDDTNIHSSYINTVQIYNDNGKQVKIKVEKLMSDLSSTVSLKTVSQPLREEDVILTKVVKEKEKEKEKLKLIDLIILAVGFMGGYILNRLLCI